jgi:TRAP-type uncharacterized transport system substrate-binding protein
MMSRTVRRLRDGGDGWRRYLRPLAILLALTATSLAAWHYWAAPTVFRIAVGPQGSEQARFIAALADTLAAGAEDFRLVPVIVDGSPGASAALDERKVELAVLRSDDSTSQSARSVVILHHRALVILGRSDKVKTFSALRGKNIVSVLSGAESNRALVDRVLGHFGVAEATLTDASMADAKASLQQGRADALVFLAPPGGRLIRDLIGDLTTAKTPISFLEIPAPEALVLRFPYLKTMTIPAGVFGGIPQRPAEAVESVSITYELVASRFVPDRAVAGLTKVLLATQLKNYASEGAPFAIEAPPTDETRRFMPHAGAKAFLDDNAQTWLETYSDQIWLALFAFSMIGSSVTGFLVWMGVRRPPASDERIHELPALMDRIVKAKTPADLEKVQRALDKIIEASVRDYAKGALADEGDSERPFWLAHVQSLIQHRMEQLRTNSDAAPRAGASDS